MTSNKQNNDKKTNYTKITNPRTLRQTSIHSKVGQNILSKYIQRAGFNGFNSPRNCTNPPESHANWIADLRARQNIWQLHFDNAFSLVESVSNPHGQWTLLEFYNYVTQTLGPWSNPH
jgi:hypothetical protein